VQASGITAIEYERGFDYAASRFDPGDLPLHHRQFSGECPRFSRVRVQRREMNLKLLGAHLKSMQLVDQRETSLSYR
jgi:hypothetical protein